MSEYDEDISINKHHLDWEWERQADLYLKWSKQHAKAVQIEDIRKSKLDMVKAELDSSLRSKPERFGLNSKPTNPEIEAGIIRQKKYRKALRSVLKAKYDVKVFEGVKKSLEQKKAALENLVRLNLAGYYASPYLKSDTKHKMFAKREEEEIKKLNRFKTKKRIKIRKKRKE